MTPKEKARELVKNFKKNTRAFNETNGWEDSSYDAKQCALICVDETLNQFIEIHNKFKGANLIKGDVKESANYIYWQEVKEQIELL